MTRERRSSPPGEGLDADHAEGRRDDTRMVQGEDQHDVPRMPHERDESGDSQAKEDASHGRMARQAQKDTERGVADTSKGAELDATYDRLRESTPDGEKKFRP
ncbi:hypothetical protein [Ramlibacter humi]|uniref:Uncharacterized protein n=1 Tax=Ramlibacter humi TaxID=2530451 RepID=A0A4Z0BQZ1_9BURK|nr:hypothetical protein [Ramlibacter humi]TFZ01723.1 hypothetical protein EZ216_11035 [Ramlibacter humi]